MRATIVLPVIALVAGACGTASNDSGTATGDDRPSIVVTTSVLGDIVANLVGDLADVETILPPGADPHDFQASARQVSALSEADVMVTNGAGLEEGLMDQLDSAESDGTPMCVAIDGVDTIAVTGSGEHDSGDDPDHAPVDPHFFTDPARTASAAAVLLDCIAAEIDGLDTDELRAAGAGYIADLDALDTEVSELLAGIAAEDRVMVTNHNVFGYFADRYGFEVAGTVIPSATTQSQSDAAALADLAELVRERDIDVVFTETSSSDDLARTLADEVGEVEVVALFSESLGPDGGETYLDMVRTNAQRVAEALR